MNVDNNTETSYRYERKFNITGLSANEIESIVKNHPAMFSEIFHQRYINNIYFDDYNFSNFYQNINGNSKRIKYRIRWYGDFAGYIEKPFFEIKIRQGNIGEKPTYPLVPFNVYEGMPYNSIREIVLNSQLPDDIIFSFEFQKAVVANRYLRKYFKSADNKFRITLDSDISYYRLQGINLSFNHNFADFESVVIEIKYDIKDENSIMNITNFFPFRITKNSKYVNGIENMYLF